MLKNKKVMRSSLRARQKRKQEMLQTSIIIIGGILVILVALIVFLFFSNNVDVLNPQDKSSIKNISSKQNYDNIKVTKLPKNTDRLNIDLDMVEVTQDYATVYIYDKKVNEKNPLNSPMPKGAVDFVKKTSGEYSLLNSKKRVRTNAVNTIDKNIKYHNNVNNIAFNETNKYTEIVFNLDWNVPFDVNYSPIDFFPKNTGEFCVDDFSVDNITITFDYTSKVNEVDFKENKMFSGAAWEETSNKAYKKYTLTLPLKQSGKFYGYNAFYDDSNNLVIRFTHPIEVVEANNDYGFKFNGGVIVIDPGHGNKDPGTQTTLNGKTIPEMSITKGVSDYLKTELEKLGATVHMIDVESEHIPASERAFEAAKYEPNLFLSIHMNGDENKSYYGLEGFYFTPFSFGLADGINKNLEEYYKGELYKDNEKFNRGVFYSTYLVTQIQNFPSVLTEYGYLTNDLEGGFMNSKDTQLNYAKSTVKGIIDFYK